MRRFIHAVLWLLAALYVGLALLMLFAPNNQGGDVFFLMVIAPCAIAAYFLPTIVAFRLRSPYRYGIFAANLVLAETGIGWIILMSVALAGGESSKPKTERMRTLSVPSR